MFCRKRGRVIPFQLLKFVLKFYLFQDKKFEMKHTYMYIVKVIPNPLFHYHQSDLTFHRNQSHYQNLKFIIIFSISSCMASDFQNFCSIELFTCSYACSHLVSTVNLCKTLVDQIFYILSFKGGIVMP